MTIKRQGVLALRSVWLWWSIGLAFLLANLLLFWFATEQVRAELVRARFERDVARAHALSHELEQTLESAMTVLQQLQNTWSDRLQADPALFMSEFREVAGRTPFFKGFFLVDATGNIHYRGILESAVNRIDPATFVAMRAGREFPQMADLLHGTGERLLLVRLAPFQGRGGDSLVFVLDPALLPGVQGSGAMLLLRAEVMGGRDAGAPQEAVPIVGEPMANAPLQVSLASEALPVAGGWASTLGGSLRLAGGLLLLFMPLLFLLWRERRIQADRQQAIADLAASEERYRLTFAAIRDGTWDWDIRTGEVRCNACWFEMLGYPADSFPVTVEKWWAMLHPDDQHRFETQINAWRQATEPFSMVYRLARADGGWVWLEARGRAVAFDEERPVRIVGSQTDISARVAVEEALSRLASYRMNLLNQIAVGIFLSSPERIILEVNERGAEMFGYQPEELLGQSYRLLHLDDHVFSQFASLYDQLHREGEVRTEQAFLNKQGEIRWVSISGTYLERGSDIVIWTMLDITKQYLAQVAFKTANRRLEVVVNQFPGGVLVEDSARSILLLNQAFCKLFALDAVADTLVGQEVSACVARIAPSFEDPEAFQAQYIQLSETREPNLGRELRLADGRILEQDYQPIIKKGELIGRLWVLRDVSAQKAQEARFRYLASIDSLTGLVNRRIFLERLEFELSRYQRYGGRGTAVIMLDLDHFKLVNDGYGHNVGDEVLESLGQLLRLSIRSTDLAGRLGGEEFGLLLPEIDLEGALEIAERLRGRLAQTERLIGERVLTVTASFGVTLLQTEDSPSSALGRADQALYLAKQKGRNRVEKLLPVPQ